MQEKRKQILEMVKQGKLKVEEAIILLDALENREQNEEEATQSEETSSKHNTQFEGNSEGNKENEQSSYGKYEPSVYVDFQSSSSNNDKRSFKRTSLKDKFTDFIDSALQKIKDIDLDFNFGSFQEVHHIFQHRDIYISDIYLDISNGNIKVVPWNERDVRIECDAKVYKTDTLEQARAYFMKNVRFSIDGESMTFIVEPKQIKMSTVLYIPQSQYHELQIRMFNGHVEGEQLNVKKMKVNTANGNIQFSHIHGKDLELETANGHIKLEQCQAEELEAETINGIINVQGVYEKVDLQTFSSNIVCRLLDNNSKIAFLHTKTGSIDLYLPQNMEIKGKIKSNIGNFTCDLTDMTIIEEKKDLVQKELLFEANKGKPRNLFIEASSNTGSIKVNHL